MSDCVSLRASGLRTCGEVSKAADSSVSGSGRFRVSGVASRGENSPRRMLGTYGGMLCVGSRRYGSGFGILGSGFMNANLIPWLVFCGYLLSFGFVSRV